MYDSNDTTNTSGTVGAPDLGGSKKSMKKGKLAALIGGGVALLALICATLLYLFVWSQPTKADFKNAQTDVKAINKSYATLT